MHATSITAIALCKKAGRENECLGNATFDRHPACGQAQSLAYDGLPAFRPRHKADGKFVIGAKAYG